MMKSLTKRYLQAIVAYNCRYWQHCHEHFECFYSNAGFPIGRPMVMPDDVNTAIMCKLAYNELSDDLRRLQLTYAFNNKRKLIGLRVLYTRRDQRHPLVARKITSYVIKAAPPLIDDVLHPRPATRYYCKLKTNSVVLTIPNMTRVANQALAYAQQSVQQTEA